MKKIASILALMSLIVSALYGCGSSGDVPVEKFSSSDEIESDGMYNNEGDNGYSEEDPAARPLKFNAKPNEDGVYDLFQEDEYGVQHYYYENKVSELVDIDNGCVSCNKLLINGTSDSRIAVFNKNDTMAIYIDRDELEFIKITSDIKYAPNLNFDYDLFEGVITYDKAPRRIDGLGTWLYNFYQSDEIEMNGEDYKEFLDKHAINMRTGSVEHISLIDGKKGEKFVVAGYYGTSWEACEFYADVPFWIIDSYEKLTVPIEKTRNGYFIVDLSGVEPGVYYAHGRVLEITE